MSYALHQSFHIRDGWLRKGIQAVTENPKIFSDPSASIRLGLGKNMVEALRFWLPATGLTVVAKEKGKSNQNLTSFGQLVRECDPYLEDDGTLWMLHYNLLKNPANATTWFWFFNYFGRMSFTKTQFIEELEQWNIMEGGKDTARSSFERDFDCFIRTYLPRENSISPEDTQESPLVNLKLLSSTTLNNSKLYSLTRPDPRVIPPLILFYAIKKWQEEHQPDALQISLRDMLAGQASPGRTFLLGMRLAEAIRWANDTSPQINMRFTRTAGLDVLSLPQIEADKILEMHYFQLVNPENAYRPFNEIEQR